MVAGRLLAKAAVLVAVVLFHFKMADTAGLYGLTPVFPRLVTINVTTAEQTPVGTFHLPTEISVQQLSSIDPKNKIFYAVVFNKTNNHIQLIGISLITGALLSAVNLPFSTSPFGVGIGQTCDVIPATGEVLVSGGNPSIPHQHNLLKVNPKTGSNVLITTVSGYGPLTHVSAFDPKYNIAWIQYANISGYISFYGIDINTGRVTFTIPNNLNIETLAYDPFTQLMYGVGLKVVNSTNYYRVLLTLSSQTGDINIVGPIPGYLVIDSSESAIDPANRILYCYLQPVGSSASPFQLVGIRLTDAKVMTNPVACAASTSTCPWSIGYLYP